METPNRDRDTQNLYVCEDCGDGFESPANTRECPACGGTLRNTAVTHD